MTMGRGEERLVKLWRKRVTKPVWWKWSSAAHISSWHLYSQIHEAVVGVVVKYSQLQQLLYFLRLLLFKTRHPDLFKTTQRKYVQWTWAHLTKVLIVINLRIFRYNLMRIYGGAWLIILQRWQKRWWQWWRRWYQQQTIHDKLLRLISSNEPTRKRVGWLTEREILNGCTLALQRRSFDFDFLSLSPLVLVPFSCGMLLLICWQCHFISLLSN